METSHRYLFVLTKWFDWTRADTQYHELLHYIYLSINSREAGLPTEVPPADDAPQVGDAQFILTDQRTSAVPLTGVHTAIQITCTHHARLEATLVEPLAVGNEGHVGPEEHLTGFAVCEHSQEIWKH